MDVIKCADYVIDLGPEGGDKGGNIVAVGTPEEVAACGASYTGQFLKENWDKQSLLLCCPSYRKITHIDKNKPLQELNFCKGFIYGENQFLL